MKSMNLSETMKWSCQLFLILLKAQGTIDLAWGWVFIPTWVHFIGIILSAIAFAIVGALTSVVENTYSIIQTTGNNLPKKEDSNDE